MAPLRPHHPRPLGFRGHLDGYRILGDLPIPCVPCCVPGARVLTFTRVAFKVLTGYNARQHEVFLGFAAAIACARSRVLFA